MAKEDEEPVIDDDDDDDDDSDDDMPELENAEGDADPTKAKQSRSEKKSRKAIARVSPICIQFLSRIDIKMQSGFEKAHTQ